MINDKWWWDVCGAARIPFCVGSSEVYGHTRTQSGKKRTDSWYLIVSFLFVVSVSRSLSTQDFWFLDVCRSRSDSVMVPVEEVWHEKQSFENVVLLGTRSKSELGKMTLFEKTTATTEGKELQWNASKLPIEKSRKVGSWSVFSYIIVKLLLLLLLLLFWFEKYMQRGLYR